MNSIKLKRFIDIYTGNSISDSDKEKYTIQNDNTIPYISTKDIEIGTNKIDYFNDMYVDIIKNSNFKIAKKNNILLCIEGGSAGKKIAQVNKEVCFVNKLCCFNPSKEYNDRFVYFYLQSDLFLSQFNLNMTGLIGGVSQSIIKEFKIPYYKIDLQNKITNYLDKKVSKINETIENNKNSIKLLENYKNSLITRTMNFGIRKDIKIVNTNIKWIPEIPKHWKIEKLNNISKKTISYGVVKLFDPDDKDGIKIIRCSDVKEGYIVENNIRTITKKLSNEYKRTILSEGDIIINVRGTLGGCSVVPKEMEGYNIAREVALISPHKEYNSKYIMYALLSNTFKEYLNYNLAGTIYLGINMNSLSKYLLAIPEYEEQNEIVEYLNNMCDKFDKIILYRKKIIEKLEEYKSSLIYEVITGKKEV